jgi:hypothetical protein
LKEKRGRASKVEIKIKRVKKYKNCKNKWKKRIVE